MSASWSRGSTRRWREVRAATLAAKGRACTLRLVGCTGWADTVHHTRGRAVTGDDPRYLEPACSSCNLRVGDPTRAPDPTPQPRTEW